MNFNDADWVDQMLALPPMPVSEAKEAAVARPGSLWHSVATRRRGAVLWATEDHVCLTFTDYAHCVYTKEAFQRLYVAV